MPTTSNFGWTTPADTDLVKDGAAAIRTLGNGVDASFVDLKGGTTGQVLAKASNTDLDFTWTAGGDITEVIAGTGLSGGGTSGSVTLTNTVATAFDAAGDLVYGTGADTFTKLSLGTASQVLTVNSGATAPEWQTLSTGGMTLINTGGTTLSGASVTISSIPTTYNALIIYIRNFKPATDGSSCYMRFNGDSNTRYNYGTSDGSNITFAQDFISVVKDADDTVANGITQIEIPDYANTSTWKQCHVYGQTPNATTTTNYNRGWNYGLYNQTAAITSLTFYASSGNMTSGTVFVYGVK